MGPASGETRPEPCEAVPDRTRTRTPGAPRKGLDRFPGDLGTMAHMTSPALTVGFDLDMTLIDSRPGIHACFEAMAARTGTYIDSDLVVTRLGPPLEEELAHWFPAEDIPATADLYRAMYPEHAITGSLAMPGAREAVTAVRAAPAGAPSS